MSEADKQLSELNKVMKQIDKEYGKGLISEAHKAKALDISRLPTGSFSLDVELGGGLPEGRINVVAGIEGSGKTTMCLKMAANAQKKYPHRRVLWVDPEGALDRDWAETHGVDLERLIVSQPEYAEQALEITDVTIHTGAISLAVVDSMTALVPGAELEGSMEDQQMGLQARINGKFLRKASTAIRYNRRLTEESSKITVLLISQIREQLNSYGNPEIIPGGRAMRHYPSSIIFFRGGDWIKANISGQQINVGRNFSFRIGKNKTYSSKRQGEFDMYFIDYDEFSKGQIDRLKEVVTYGVYWDVIEKSGKWYYLGEKNFDGAENFLNYIRDNPEEREQIEKEVMELTTLGKTKRELNVDPDTGEILD